MADLGNATLYLGTDDSKMQKGMADAERSTSRTLGAMRTLAVGAGLAAAGAIAAIGASALNVSNETDKATKKIRAQLRTTEKEAKRLGKVAKDVFKNNFADSIEESGEAVMLLSEQLGDAARGQEQALVEAAFGLRDAFGPEVDKVIAAVSTLVEEFDDLDPTQAMDLVVTGFQRGLDKSGDFLDSIGEYSNLFSDAEFSAAEFFSTMETGQAGGVLGTDKIADAMKEFQIRLIEGSDAVSEALTGVGLNADEIFAGLSDGTLSVKDVWDQLLPAINAIEDPLERNRALVELLGTQAEDLGTDFTEGLDSGKTSLNEMEGAAESLNTQYENVTDSISALWRNVIVEISPLTDLLVSMANTHLPAISKWVTDSLPGVVTAMTNFLEDPAGTLSDMFALPSADTIVADLKELWPNVRTKFSEWMTTANTRIQDFFKSPSTKSTLIKLQFSYLIAKRNFKAWLTSAAQRVTDFFAAPASDPLVKDLKAAWEKAKDDFREWVVDHLIADYIQLPEGATWAEVLKAVWQSAKSAFDGWITSANMAIRDYLGLPDSSTWAEDIKAAWSTAKTTFDSWIASAGMAIRDYIQLPEGATWAEVLKAVWQSAKSAFDGWITSANMAIRDYLGLPDSSTWAEDIKAAWSTAKTTFDSWIASAEMAIRDYIQLPEGATWAEVLKAVWQSAKSAFDGWLTSANEKIRDYFDIPDSATFAQVLQTIWSSVRQTFSAWLTSAGEKISDYIKIPSWSDVVQSLKDLWQGPGGVRQKFESWLDTSKNLISKFWELPAVQDFVSELRGMWDGPGGAKSTFESWLAEPDNRPKITFGYEAPDSESEETRGFFAQLKQTMLAGLNAIFGDVDIIGSLLAPIIAALGTDPALGFQGIIDKISETLRTVESAFNAADEAVDSFFENFNADILDALFSAALSGITAKLNEWSATIVNGFSALWSLISGIWTGGGDDLNTLTTEKFAAIQLSLSGKFQILRLAMQIAWAGIKIIWSNAWAAITTVVTDAWTSITTYLSTASAALYESTRSLWALITGVWQGAWDGLNSIVQTAWATLTTFLTESFAMLGDAFAIAMIWINQGWAAGWETIKATVASAWAEIQSTMENLFGGFGDWVQERVNDVGRGVVAIANSIIDVVNAIVAAINKPIRAWNDLSFGVGRIGRSFTYPTGVSLDGITTATKWFGFPGFDVKTTNLPVLPSLSQIGYGGGGGQPNENIAMLASGGLALGPTMAMIGEREPEAVLRMDQLRDFAGVGEGSAKPDLHLHIENAYGIDNLVDQLNEAWLDGRLRGLQDQLAGVG